MATDHTKEPKCCCLDCGKEFYAIYFNKHTKTCKRKSLKEGLQKVPCPICGKRLKEINTSHLLSHDMNITEFKKLYPNYETLSSESRLKKSTLSNMTPELSKKLSYGHTLEAKINKWGEEEGVKRHDKSLDLYSRSKTKEGYIEKWGEAEGLKRWGDRIEKTSLASKRVWTEPSEVLKVRGTLKGYQDKWGEEEGKNRWLRTCRNRSLSLRKIPLELKEDYSLYHSLVKRVSELNLKMYNPEFLARRSKENHIDHKYSCYQGFLDLTSPYLAGYIGNLELLPRSQNCSKQHNCSLTLSELEIEVNSDKNYCEVMGEDLIGINPVFAEIMNRVVRLKSE